MCNTFYQQEYKNFFSDFPEDFLLVLVSQNWATSAGETTKQQGDKLITTVLNKLFCILQLERVSFPEHMVINDELLNKIGTMSARTEWKNRIGKQITFGH